MDTSMQASSRRSYDIPKPETGLAEWTSKIKALQREVDADEEAEQKRLEEEISAARQARLRRSRGAGSRGDSLDISNNRELPDPGRFDDTSSVDTLKSVAERAKDQDTALRKLMARNDVYNPDKIASSTSSRGPAIDTSSLASFIGGRANGPRLNRHAPQQDAHDPTQFIQPDLSAPHPVFGKGGIAMPGLASKKENRPGYNLAGSELSERYQPSFVKDSVLKSSSGFDTVVPDSRNDENFDERKRSFTLGDRSNSHSHELKEVPKTAPKVEPPSGIGSSVRGQPFQMSRDSYPTGHKTSSVPVPESTRPSATYASKPLPSYLGTTYTAKPIPASSPSPTGGSSISKSQTSLQRLMETNNVHNPDKLEPRKTIAERAQSVSLAGFIGGKAGGPRLNKPAPQPDAHDPTQFIQPDTSAPHPVFGKGGVAMPGLATRKVSEFGSVADNSERYRPSTKAVWPPVKTPYAEKSPANRPSSPQKAKSRERTVSTPGSRPNFPTSAARSSDGRVSSNISSYEIGRLSPSKGTRSNTPGRDRTLSTPSSQPVTPVPGLARPIQPIPKSAAVSPLLSSTVPSPAFQKPAASKDLTPSISRLQGRGFVQSMVKVSSQLDSTPATPPPPTDKPRPVSASGRKSSVLDRWQPHAQQSPSPTKSYTPIRRSATQEPITLTSDNQSTISIADNTTLSHSLKSAASLPSLAKSAGDSSNREMNEQSTSTPEPYRSRTPGLGSATTMVLIKPSKSATDLTQLAHVDELGVKHDSLATPSTKKPLIHPTKERPRKPKRTVGSHDHDEYSSRGQMKPDAEKLVTTKKIFDMAVNVSSNSQTPVGAGNLPVMTPNKEQSVPQNIATSENKADDHKHHEQHTAIFVPRPEPVEPVDGKHSLKAPENVEAPIMNPRSQPTSPVPSSFNKRGRTSSTGNRPTVMEVARALIDQEGLCPAPTDITDKDTSSVQVKVDKPTSSVLHVEKRRSTYEKYSSFALPALKEEATPNQTPVGTVNSRNGDVKQDCLNDIAILTVPVDNKVNQNEVRISETNNALLDSDEEALTTAEVANILKSADKSSMGTSDSLTISVDILALIETTASPVLGPPNVFYESELLVVVHRTKSKSNGLATMSIWCWLGRKSILGDREEKKLNDLAKRYGTSAVIIYQLAEPIELIQCLGGTLIIRQGSRTHWSPDNTTMHVVRSLRNVFTIDEVDLNIRNLCSAFSYCLTVLGSIYVWHGRGSIDDERAAAMEYAKSLANGSSDPVELLEEESDNDEMFWLILGEDEYAKADYWKWRKTVRDVNPSIWRAEPGNAKGKIIPIDHISLEKSLQNSVYIINCLWELFVLVGKDARSNRRAIKFALTTATNISHEVSSSRPYTPPVHVLILPSRIPLDLQLGIRDLDEAWLNNGEIPDHMNLLSRLDAVSHLATHTWGGLDLKNQDMLPLGVAANTDVL